MTLVLLSIMSLDLTFSYKVMHIVWKCNIKRYVRRRQKLLKIADGFLRDSAM